MRSVIAALIVVAALSTAHARPGVAKECKRNPCRHAIARCVKEACAQFKGIVKYGCKRAARSALLGSCTVFGDHTTFCSDLSAGNGCTPD